MNGRRWGAVGAVVAIFLVGACSSGSSSNGDKAAYCKTAGEIRDQVRSATSLDQAVTVFKSNQDKLDTLVKTAPSEVKSDTQLVVDAVRKIIQTGDATPFGAPNLTQARQRTDAFCGFSSSSTSSSASSNTSSSSSGTASRGLPVGLVACDLFDLNALGTQTNLTWTVADRSANDACTITADNGNTVAIGLVPTQGQNDAALEGAKSGCDSGTFTAQNVIDGGYVCQVGGVASAGAIFQADNIFVAISAKTFNGATTDQVQAALLDVLKDFVAPGSTPTYSS